MWGRSGNVAWLARHCQHDERAHQNAQLHSTADPGELLAGLEASINMFQGVSRPTSTWNSKRNKAGHADATHYEDAAVEQILRNCRNPQGMSMPSDGELARLLEIYMNARVDKDDPMGGSGEGEQAGLLVDPGSASASARAADQQDRPSATLRDYQSTGTPPEVNEEDEISAEREEGGHQCNRRILQNCRREQCLHQIRSERAC